jgi:hypothetical protein
LEADQCFVIKDGHGISPARVACRSVLIGLTVLPSVLGQDVSVDKLLNKLPPPEKLAKPPVERALQQPDPAIKDPLVGQIVRSLSARQ